MKKKNLKKGFTLIELIVVIAILAILAAVAIPNFMSLTKKAEIAVEVAAAQELAGAINLHNVLATKDEDKITSIGTASEIMTALGDLKPTFDNVDDAAVVARLGMEDGLAKVTNRE